MRSLRVVGDFFVEESLLSPGGGAVGSNFGLGSQDMDLVALFSLKIPKAHE